MVVWITGLSGAGKTTIAGAVAERLRAAGRAAVLIDGDELRAAVGDPAVGHDRASRLVNAHRIRRFAALLERQGVTVVVATMSLFHEVHRRNRAEFGGYLEVLVRAAPDTLRARDPKGIYERSKDGSEPNVGGVDLTVEMPEAPDLVLDNGTPADIETNVAAVTALVLAG